MSRRLNDRISTMMEEALDLLAMGDDVTWDFTLAATPTGGAVGMLFMFLPNGVLGESLAANLVWTNPTAVTSESLQEDVRQLLEALRNARSQTLAKVPQPQSMGAS